MTLILPLFCASVVVNLLLAANLLIAKSEIKQKEQLLYGTIQEKGRLRRIIRKIKLYQN
jgi:hypothetical protein